jgi:hypothetical protein
MPCPPPETPEQKLLAERLPAALINPAWSTFDLLGTVPGTPEQEEDRRRADAIRYVQVEAGKWSGMIMCNLSSIQVLRINTF